MQSDMLERGTRCVPHWIKPQTNDFHDFFLINFSLFLLQLDRYSLRRSAATDGRCKDDTSKELFSTCESLQGVRVQVKNLVNDTKYKSATSQCLK